MGQSQPWDGSTRRWWRQLEATRPGALSASGSRKEPVWLRNLRAAALAELALRPDEAARFLRSANPIPPKGPWRGVAKLIQYRIEIRHADGKVLARRAPEIQRFAADIEVTDPETAARAWHQFGVLCVRTNRFDDAQEAFVNALRGIGDCPARAWILDTFGQALIGQGAWEESRRVFRAVVELKRAAGDYQGVAVSIGNLARLEMRVGNAAEVVAMLSSEVKSLRGRIAPTAELRLRTALLEALLAAGLPAARQAEHLRRLLRGASPHYLLGYAHVALAQIAAANHDNHSAARELACARPYFKLADQQCLLHYWEARLGCRRVDGAAALRGFKTLFRSAGMVTEGEVLFWQLLAERAGARADRPAMRRHLETAASRAGSANNPLWIVRVDEAYRRLDPEGQFEQMVRRFTGRPLAEMSRTVKERVTIVFSDLVNFTPRSQELSPEDVMRTVRGLFELAVPFLVRHRVRPLSYLGDGLLAICQGPGHERRGLAFATDLVRKTILVTKVREALGERWGLTMRAGVASGPVVLGALGSLLKTEFAAIGMTTNMAARLQGKAEPGEVMCLRATAEAAGVSGLRERLELKGVTKRVEGIRLAGEDLRI